MSYAGAEEVKMAVFRCFCSARVFFENTRCLNCNRELGFLPDLGVLSALEPEANGVFRAEGRAYFKCSNNVEHGVCNWLVPQGVDEKFCRACRLNNVIPDLSNAENRRLWGEVEQAKRRLIYTLNRLGLPILSKMQDPERGLAFDIKADTGSARVLTGHADGLITLNLAEADSVVREEMRVQLKERYRTLLGHFRHEVGHYYWERLVRDAGGERLIQFRERFGDERADYAQALERHYALATSSASSDATISHYAAAHPWEDWAETFAHYLHMIDTLETAFHFGFTADLSVKSSVTNLSDFDALISEWSELTVALNALNRSMGLQDAYPFAISPTVRSKLAFVHQLVRGVRVQPS